MESLQATYTICGGESEKVLCAVQLQTPENGAHIQTHYVFLIDTSGSMEEEHKIDNVKRCITTMMNYVQENDYFSLITFESRSIIHIDHLQTTPANKTYIQQIVQKIQSEDMTNLSAGIGNVRKVVQGHPEKTALFLLTDGNVNQGITNEDALQELVQGILTEHGSIQVYCIGYGTNHNANLLRGISVEGNGSYNIVNCIEDVGSAFGDTVGGLISIVAQNVEIEFPAGSTVLGLVKQKVMGNGSGGNGASDRVIVQVGDVYAGTQPIFLAEIPRSILDIEGGNSVKVSAMELPNLTERIFQVVGTIVKDEDVDPFIKLSRLRHICTELLMKVHKWDQLFMIEDKEAVKSQLNAFKNEITASIFDGSVLAQQLRDEIPVMERIVNGQRADVDTQNIMSQHMAYFGLGRGLNTSYMEENDTHPIPATPRIRRHIQLRSREFQLEEEEEESDPINMIHTVRRNLTTHSSAFQSPTQRSVSNQFNNGSE